MGKLIGRVAEQKQMRKYVESEQAEFIAVYGRRRVGKTFLIREMFGNEFAFEVSGTIGGKRGEQMFNFMQALRRFGYEGSESPATWNEAFDLLQRLLQPKVERTRCILFFDELPCFDTPRAGFVKAFEHFWNGWASQYPGIKLIVCGSATSWMVDNIIDNHGGLHNRITHEVHLAPFALAEVEQYCTAYGFAWSRLSILHVYMAMGGIPYYLSLLDNTQSPAQNIDRLLFSEHGELHREYDRLFRSLFTAPDAYMAIIAALVENKQGISREEIATKVKLANNGHLTKLLTNLVNCDFIRRYSTKEKKVKANAHLYQLTDMFILFHHTFAKRPTTDPHYWSNMMGTPAMSAWLGLAFERVCLLHIPQIKQALGIGGIHTEYYAWRSRQSAPAVQIDLIIERADQMINLCEVKYSEYPYAIDKNEEARMRLRIGAFSSETACRKGILPTFITTFGLNRNAHSGLVAGEVTMDDLFKE